MRKLLLLLSQVGLNGFFVLLLCMIALAAIYPLPGTKASPVPLGTIAHFGVSVIFFFYGLRLSPAKLIAGLTNWRLHLSIQASTFLLFPVVILLAYWIIAPSENQHLWLGTFYLAALPSTVSSSVVLISIARGNIAAGIFNASISSILGIFITPLWMTLFIRQTNISFDLSSVIIRLVLEILLPVALGISLHRFFGSWAEKKKKILRYFDQSIILLIVYTAFCESFAGNMFGNLPVSTLLILPLLMLIFFFLMFGSMELLSRIFSFSRPDRITLLFSGSKKSLVQGAVMGKALFPDPALLGIILLPLMMYHALQLLAGSTIAQNMGRKIHFSENKA